MKVIIIEDDKVIADQLIEMLKNEDAKIQVASMTDNSEKAMS